jgi:hypothetical protein
MQHVPCAPRIFGAGSASWRCHVGTASTQCVSKHGYERPTHAQFVDSSWRPRMPSMSGAGEGRHRMPKPIRVVLLQSANDHLTLRQHGVWERWRRPRWVERRLQLLTRSAGQGRRQGIRRMFRSREISYRSVYRATLERQRGMQLRLETAGATGRGLHRQVEGESQGTRR